MILHTDRLLVRECSPDDADFVFDMYARWEVRRFLGPAPVLNTPAEALQRIERWQIVSRANPLLGVWAVTLSGSGEPVGTVMLKMAPLSSSEKPLPLSDDHEIGWHLHPKHWGHGYATEVTLGVIERARSAGVVQVIALIHPDNEPSKRVAQRLGLEHIGRTDRYYGMEAELYRAVLDP